MCNCLQKRFELIYQILNLRIQSFNNDQCSSGCTEHIKCSNAYSSKNVACRDEGFGKLMLKKPKIHCVNMGKYVTLKLSTAKFLHYLFIPIAF
ncbi:hypothetical protein XELAEV_18024691mg [Xenopus laevis]|uniref:Uncharacterized protein n=1 Tax=Xenopus laevis TaxID=8355 RepID=A0A974CY71_XENLA|nr:hypothetical protein XELAEV_18024691mg [Xenopus laevis]